MLLDKFLLDEALLDQTGVAMLVGPDPTVYDFGIVLAGQSYETGLDYFELTNKSLFPIDIEIYGTDMADGTTWELTDNAVPGANKIGLLAGLEGGAYDIIIRKLPPYNLLVERLEKGATQKWGIMLKAPTLFDDDSPKTGTVTLAAYAS